MAKASDVKRALAGDKNLREADLSGADLSEADLIGADLSHASLTGANLRGASLTGASLTGASLRGASLTGADLYDANLTEANLYGADLSDANLYDANLTEANLTGADLRGADLRGANLYDADLYDAELSSADLTGANLTEANLSDANLSGADLIDASLYDANLTEANLTGANLTGANLTGARLTGANLTGARFTGANLTGAIGLEGSRTLARGSGYGRASGAVLKLLGEGPQTAREYKRKYPAEFERLKALTGGRDFDPATIKSIVAQTRGARWLVTKQAYGAKAQRLCSNSNDVLLFNIDLEAQQLDDEAKAQLRKLSEVSRRSGHPHEKGDKLFTVGWVRYCDGGKAWLVEEVQSDVYVARYGLKDEKTREQLRAGGISPEQFERTIEALKPWTERFYEDALGVTFALAKQKGIAVEVIDYDYKVRRGVEEGWWDDPTKPVKDEEQRRKAPPKRVYVELPRDMGMTRRERGEVLDAPAWHYRPNPSRKRR
jgi:uncharacterized protein YjbI with pentapeptide repeats